MTHSSEDNRMPWQQAMDGAWRLVVFIVIYFISLRSSTFWSELFGAPSGGSPGDNPPWYFIRQDFFTGVGCLAGAFIMLGITLATWKRYRSRFGTNDTVLMMICISMVPPVIKSTVIYFRCSKFFDYDHSVSYWPTFNSYLSDYTSWIGLTAGFLLFLAYFVVRERWRTSVK